MSGRYLCTSFCLFYSRLGVGCFCLVHAGRREAVQRGGGGGGGGGKGGGVSMCGGGPSKLFPSFLSFAAFQRKGLFLCIEAVVPCAKKLALARGRCKLNLQTI